MLAQIMTTVVFMSLFFDVLLIATSILMIATKMIPSNAQVLEFLFLKIFQSYHNNQMKYLKKW